MFNLIPREVRFFDSFEQQSQHMIRAAGLLQELVQNFADARAKAHAIKEVEHQGDQVTHEVVKRLNTTFITPIDREDIHALAKELDDVVDLVQSLSSRMLLYRVEKSAEDLVQMADILLQSTENVRKAIVELRQPEKYRRVLDHCIEVNRLENAGDTLLGLAIGKLFTGRPEPLEVIKWKEIYEVVEEAIDKCEDVANTIESILVKHG